jgi:CheY-like chemotaxis protein
VIHYDSKRRVLLVEDDDQSRIALQDILIQEGFDVEAARDGGEGIELVASYRPDIIILDLALPGINGFEAAQWLKSRRETSGIPLMAVTASWLGADRARLRRIGFSAALRKPFAPNLLVEELQKLLPG